MYRVRGKQNQALKYRQRVKKNPSMYIYESDKGVLTIHLYVIA